MKKFIDSFEGKTSSARLLECSGDSSSQGPNYQACSDPGDGKKKHKNGVPFLRTKTYSCEETGEKFHRITGDDEDSKTRFLCVVGCCGGGRLSLVWMNKHALLPNEEDKDEFLLQSNSNISRQEDTCLTEVDGSIPPKEPIQGASISDRDTSEVCSDDLENSFSDKKLGRIQFSIHYDFPEQTLTLRIIRATDLVAKDFSGTSDPYVKIMLLPDKKRKLMTNVKRKNLNPRWNEVFAFEGGFTIKLMLLRHAWFLKETSPQNVVKVFLRVLEAHHSLEIELQFLKIVCTKYGFPYTKLMNKTLYLQVLDYDRFSRDDPIGEVCIPLTEFNLSSGQTIWKNLQPCKSHTGKLGELQVGLCYHPSNGLLTVNIQRARDLKAKDINGLSDPYVKIWILLDGRKHEKKKTKIIEKSLNPQFGEMFTFNVAYDKIRQTSLMISVMDYDRMGRNEQIGQILLGSKSGPMEVKHWNEMFSKSRQEVIQWHVLKDFG